MSRSTTPLGDVTSLGTVLGVWAHPDDEAFTSAGLMAMARQAGQRVVCVTATWGERGTPDPDRWPPSRLAQVRAAEVRASLAALDVREHHHLGVVDGTCADQPFDVMVDQVAAIAAQVRPDTVVTFGPDGLTGHEDHQTVSAWATAAWHEAAPGARLLYATTTDDFADRWSHLHDRLDVFLADGLPLRTRRHELALDLDLDDEVADRKLVALRAQASQTTGLVEAVGADVLREWWRRETFVAGPLGASSARTWGTWTVAA
ncbi:MAG TPA: PIG-L family deacetylase [Jiangellales bacterium]|nr:PIG-L family deacetylase [Jiangellales bacterium]